MSLLSSEEALIEMVTLFRVGDTGREICVKLG